MRRGNRARPIMSLKKLPLLQNFELPDGLERGVNGDRLRDWMPDLELTNLDAQATAIIDIFDEIGGDVFFGGFNSAMLARALQGVKDVTVNINSPGGSYIEGVAMFNMLVQHPGKITVNVLGQASSAAAIVAMAADQLNMAPASVLFIHNVHADVYGDKNGMREVADVLDKLDGALTGIYAARSGQRPAKIADMLDKETTLTAKEAVDLGLADKVLEDHAVKASPKLKNAAETVRADRMLEHAFRNTFPGMSRTTFLAVKNAFRDGTPGAAISPTRDAGAGEVAEQIRALAASINPST